VPVERERDIYIYIILGKQSDLSGPLERAMSATFHPCVDWTYISISRER